jgi:hypothetical protein
VDRPSASFSVVATDSATTDGLTLQVSVAKRAATKGVRYSVTTTVAADLSTPVTLKTPDGLEALVLVRSLESSEVVFDSRKANAEALGTNPGVVPQESEILSDGQGGGAEGSATFEFTLSTPGHYELTARTFGPAASISPIIISAP